VGQKKSPGWLTSRRSSNNAEDGCAASVFVFRDGTFLVLFGLGRAAIEVEARRT